MLLPLLTGLLLAEAAGAQDGLVHIPASARTVNDGLTGVPVTVTIPAFRIGATEVTQADFEAVTGFNPSHHRGADLPVENVTWWDAIRYANMRSAREGLAPAYDLATGSLNPTSNGYRLPTDAEWQAAAGEPVKGAQANLGSANTKDTAELLRELQRNGTRPVRSYPPNLHGLYDMTGNVWEWCHDFFDPANAVHRMSGPRGPAAGVNRIIRGGSFLSTVSSWGRGYRSSMPPDHKSRFTGFRIARGAAEPARLNNAAWYAPYNQPPAAFASGTGSLTSLVPDRRSALREKWTRILGSPNVTAPRPNARLLASHRETTYTGRLMLLQVEPDYWEKIHVMTPHGPHAQPLPVVIVPYYDVDTPAGTNLGGRNFMPPGVRSFALLAVQYGFMAVGIRWFGESYGEGYTEAVANLKLRHPGATGLGKWVWDARRLLDWIETMPEADATRIGMIGHSLGGKMTLYAAAMDPRITAAVSSEPGIGLAFSNYDDYWYLGERVRTLEPGTDHHELLALIAPRPFLLIGGDSSDNDRSWLYINAARPLYAAAGRPEQIGYVNHRKGHTPTPESVKLAMEWLHRFLTR